jgi:hypothetical protein
VKTAGGAFRFHAYRTVWERLDHGERSRWSGFDSFHRAMIAAAKRKGMYLDAEAEIVTEHDWLVLGKPYYKLWPGYAAMLARTSLAIPTEVFRAPHEAFAILIPAHTGLFQFEHAGRILEIRSLLVSHATPMLYPHPCFSVIVDDGELQRSRATIRLEPGRTIEECLARTPFDGTTSPEMMATAMRLSVAVSLLAVSVHRCVEHDVIAALRERYGRAETCEERERLAEKSRRRGVNGWCVGRGRCLSLTTASADAESQPTGRQLLYQHVRGGHFHTVRYGPGRSKAKVMFYEPTLVRPDLPPPPPARARAG